MISLQTNNISMEWECDGCRMSNDQRLRQNYPGYVIMKAFPEETDSDALQILFCNKNNQRECWVFIPKIESNFRLQRKEEWPQFVHRMNPSIFKTIGGVVDYKYDSKNVYLLLFNIEGRPKYCITPWNELSNGVRYERQLIPNYYSDHYFSATHRRI